MWHPAQKGWIETVNICGRVYVTQESVKRFYEGAKAGEFAKPFSGAAAKYSRPFVRRKDGGR